MSGSHLFYIPLVLLAGVVLGVALGRRSARLVYEEEQAARRSRAESDREAAR